MRSNISLAFFLCKSRTNQSCTNVGAMTNSNPMFVTVGAWMGYSRLSLRRASANEDSGVRHPAPRSQLSVPKVLPEVQWGRFAENFGVFG